MFLERKIYCPMPIPSLPPISKLHASGSDMYRSSASALSRAFLAHTKQPYPAPIHTPIYKIFFFSKRKIASEKINRPSPSSAPKPSPSLVSMPSHMTIASGMFMPIPQSIPRYIFAPYTCPTLKYFVFVKGKHH